MPRAHRLLGAGVTYHITAHATGGDALFVDDGDRYRYLILLAEAKAKCYPCIFAYALMTTHIHLVIQTTKPNVSESIWWVHGRYAIAFNRKHTRRGHLFATRFHGRVIDRNEDLLQSTCYVHLNPVRAGIVEQPEQYPWSSFGAYATDGGDSLVDVAPVLALLAEDRGRARSAYVEFVRHSMKTARPTETAVAE
ncbi:MAG: transposase [Armatimonadetes bacterium]|nr:transposase [Armatimonadota bacterium]